MIHSAEGLVLLRAQDCGNTGIPGINTGSRQQNTIQNQTLKRQGSPQKTQAELGRRRQQQLGCIITFPLTESPFWGSSAAVANLHCHSWIGSVCQGEALVAMAFLAPGLSPQQVPPFTLVFNQPGSSSCHGKRKLFPNCLCVFISQSSSFIQKAGPDLCRALWVLREAPKDLQKWEMEGGRGKRA